MLILKVKVASCLRSFVTVKFAPAVQADNADRNTRHDADGRDAPRFEPKPFYPHPFLYLPD
ncbi:MAG: hypothetical protein V7752_21920 [Halopseudomonas sp.]